ncbi:MAG: hypothetical protein ACFFCW_01935 [Candidatus Hodarchaeota archaeon]
MSDKRRYEPPDCGHWIIATDCDWWISKKVTGYGRTIPPSEEHDIWASNDSKCKFCGKPAKEVG